jgi:hypothetical protein
MGTGGSPVPTIPKKRDNPNFPIKKEVNNEQGCGAYVFVMDSFFYFVWITPVGSW